MATQVSAGLVKRDKKLLMIFDEESETYALPSEKAEKGELSADTAERAVSDLAGCESEVVRYHKQLKLVFEKDGEKFKMQSYTVDIDGEPENGEWVPVSKLNRDNLAAPLHEIKDKLSQRI